MKATSMTSILTATFCTLGTASYSYAASTSQVYMSGTLVLLFLGFCALVLTVQLIPAIIMLYGMIKGALDGKKEKSLSSAKTH